jgi:hypothetical protein
MQVAEVGSEVARLQKFAELDACVREDGQEKMEAQILKSPIYSDIP